MKLTYRQSPIIYRQQINNSDISVSATYEGEVVLGEFTISPSAGTVLPAGDNEVKIRFVPRDSRFQEVSNKATINVATGIPSIEWKSPAPITFPQR